MRVPSAQSRLTRSQEDAHIRGEDRGLVQHDLAVSDEVAVRPVVGNKYVEPLPHEPVLVTLQSAAVDPEVEPHIEYAGISSSDADVGQQAASTRRRLLRPGETGR